MADGPNQFVSRTIDFANASPEMRIVLGIDLNDLFLSVRTKNVLRLADIRYMGELVPYSKTAVAAFQNCGAKTVEEIQDILDAYGLSFETEVVGWEAPAAPSPTDVPDVAHGESSEASRPGRLADYDAHTRAKFRLRLSELDFSRRANNLFAQQEMEFVGDLVQRREIDLLRSKACGRVTAAELADKLSKIGLSLGVTISDWDPEAAERERAEERVEQKAILAEARNAIMPLPKAECLEDELLGILGTVAQDRNREVLQKLLGWSGAGQRTLESVGQEYGVTRERIRQIGARATDRIWNTGFETPWLDQALEVARETCPALPQEIAVRLREAGISRTDFDPTGLATACEAFGRKKGFVRTSVGRTTIYEEKKCEGTAREFFRLCRRLTSANGCANFESVCDEIGVSADRREAYRRIGTLDDRCTWMDQNQNWLFANGLNRNRLSNLVSKVLHIAPKLPLSELRRAVSKSKRLASAPPLSVLATFVERIGLARVDGNKVVALSTFPVALEPGGAEETIAGVLKANGPAVSIEKLQELCVAAGMNPVTIGIYVSNSPIVARLARGVYSLVGADVPPGLVEEVGKELTASRKTAEFGWSARGTLWCAVHLTHVSLASGALSIPRFVADYAEGEWQPEIAGREVDGTVKCRDNFLWGIKRPLANAGAEPGDVCVLEFVRATRIVRMTIGGEELIDLWESGDIDVAASEPSDVDEEQDGQDLPEIDAG
jgi:Bacterial RNA polymerase, alpha chain C terminal domain/Sigma-70, region 4